MPEGKRIYRSLLRKVPEGDRRERKLGEEAGNVKKHLATTMDRKLDIRL